MKLLRKDLDKKNAGSVLLIAEEPEDMWHAYNLISLGDYLRSSTIRRVVNESSTATTTSRVRTTLTILVKNIDYDLHGSVLRVKGTNIEENPYVKMGAYHTIDLELQQKFTISKAEWDSVALARIDEACDPAHSADLAAVVMQEGLAHVCLIQPSMTTVKAKIEMCIPRKRKGLCANHDKNMERFFDRIIQSILMHINFDVVKAVIVASPGFIKDQFFEYMNQYAVQNIQTCKLLIDNRSKFVLTHSASGFKHAVKEIFDDPNLAPRLTDTKALGEVKALEAFHQMLKSEPTRAYYGYKHVEMAKEADAIDTLLISDSLFRSKELAERKKYVNIVDKVRENNGQVRIFSSMHVSGEQLMQLTGIAAILRFPMPELEDEPLSESDDEAADEPPQQQQQQQQENNNLATLPPPPPVIETTQAPAKQPKLNNNTDELKSSASTANFGSSSSTTSKQSQQQQQQTLQPTRPGLAASTANSSSSPAISISANSGGSGASNAASKKATTNNASKKPAPPKFVQNYDDDDDDDDYYSGHGKYDHYDDDQCDY